ncbi:MAG: hypothetical protein ACYDBB_01495 [Armatimonadota bacterium]
MKPVQATDQQKPLRTLQACMDAVNTRGAAGTLRWADGFAIPLGTVVYLAMTPIAGTEHLAVVYAVLGFEEGGEHHSGFHVHHVVNWSAEDPPLLFAVIDDEGRSLEFSLLVPSCDDEQIAELSAWRAQLDTHPERRDERYGFVRTALAYMAQEWAENIAQE